VVSFCESFYELFLSDEIQKFLESLSHGFVKNFQGQLGSNTSSSVKISFYLKTSNTKFKLIFKS
jgi:hypothetical protein